MTPKINGVDTVILIIALILGLRNMIYGLLHHIAIKKITKTKGEEEKFDEMSGNAFAQIFVCRFFCVSVIFGVNLSEKLCS